MTQLSQVVEIDASLCIHDHTHHLPGTRAFQLEVIELEMLGGQPWLDELPQRLRLRHCHLDRHTVPFETPHAKRRAGAHLSVEPRMSRRV